MNNIDNIEALKQHCFEKSTLPFSDKIALLTALYAPFTPEKIKIIEDIINTGVKKGFDLSIKQIMDRYTNT